MVSQVNTSHKSKEHLFFEALENLFIGVPIEGESGYINLMCIKALKNSPSWYARRHLSLAFLRRK
jgi:hypothetical protein